MRKRLVYKQVRIGLFLLVFLALLIWGILSALAGLDLFTGKLIS